MLDMKSAVGTALTTAAASASWLEVAEPLVAITVTIVVGGATLWYTVERALKLRKERVNDSGKKDTKSKRS